MKIIGFPTNTSIASNSLCVYLFPTDTLEQFGALPLCNQSSENSIRIAFTLNPKISSGDLIKIRKNVVQRVDCTSKF